MAKIAIIITGIALSYQKNNLWKVLFPFNECHNIKFRYFTEDQWSHPPVPLASPNRRIEIRPNMPTTAHSIGNYYNDFIDFTGNYAHSGGLDLLNWYDHGILLTIPNASFGVFEFTNTKCVLEENTSSPNLPVFGPAIVGYSAIAHIATSPQGYVDLVQINGNEETVLQRFNTDTYLWFDNNCDQDTPDSDTYMLYSLVTGKGGDSNRFSSERDPADHPSPYPFPGSEINFTSVRNTENSSVATDGVPCHKLRASKSDDLP
jgi:hypothetical protein